MQSNHQFVTQANLLLKKLDSEGSIGVAIELANEVLGLLGLVDKKSPEEVFESSLELPNAERYDSWFHPHPIFKSDRACFDLSDSKLFKAKFYWLKKHSRQIIAGGVHFSPNFEDEDFTHNDRYKVGVDFFLSPNGKSLQVVLSNRGNLRIVELNKRLNSTQVDIFAKWEGAGNLNTQEALHTTLWESFKLKSVNQKFYDGVSNSFTELLQHLKSIGKDEEEAKLFASRLLGRLLFCWFLRKKEIIDKSIGYFDAHGKDATAYYKQSLERLFFLTLNTPINDRDELTKKHQRALFPNLRETDQPSLFKIDQKTPYLNGGLFEAHKNDWYKDDSLTLPEGFFTNLYDHFEEFNFTTDESSPEYEQIAIDPEMLGRVFESLLATQVDETGQQARKAKGAFYTPREIVSYMCKESLRNYMYNSVNNDDSTKESIDSLLDISDSEWAKSKSNTLRDKVKDNRTQIIDALDAVTILDPACGSGAFPMGMLQLMLKTYERLENRFDPYKTKLSVIQNNIFGVDIEPMAVEISRLRAWLSLIVDEDDPRSVDPLPNLDFKFVCANSLVPLDKEVGLFSDSGLHQKLKDIRTKYFNARKKHTKKALQDEYYRQTSSEQTSLVTDDNRTKQLKSFDPFKNSKPAGFFDADHMFGINDGFSIVIGNPPYNEVSVKDEKDYYKLHYKDVLKGHYDLYIFFTKLAIDTCSPLGIICYITPHTYLEYPQFVNLRSYILANTSLIEVTSRIEGIFNAVVDNSIFILQKNVNDNVTATLSSKKIDSSRLVNVETLRIDQSGLNNKTFDIRGVQSFSKLKKFFENSVKLGDIYKSTQGITVYAKVQGEKINWFRDVYQDSDSKKVLKGRDIFPFFTKWDERYIQYGKWLWCPRNTDYFEQPKIFIRQTSDKLIAAYVEEPFYAIDSVHSFIQSDSDYSPYFLTGYLNSKLANYLYKLITNETGKVFAQVKLTKVRELPVPKLTESSKRCFSEIEKLVKEIINSVKHNSSVNTDSLKEKIDDLVYRSFELSDDEVRIIEEAVS